MPTPSIVARGAIGIRKEASFGSGGGIDNWQVFESANLTPNHHYIYQDRVRNTPEQVGGRFANRMVSGQITFPVSPANPTQWWQCGIGGTGPYTPQLPLSSLAMEIQEGDIATTYSSGDMIESIEFSSKQGDILRCAVRIEGKDMQARATASTSSFTSGDDPYLHSEATFTLDGVVNNQVVSFTCSKNNNLVKDLYATQATRRDIPATKAVVNGTIAVLFENVTMRDRFFNQLPASITAQYIRGGNSLKIDLVNLNYDVADRPLQSQTSYVVETLNYTAFINDTSQNSMKLTVV